MMVRAAYVTAVHLLLMRGDNVLLLRRFNTGYEDGKYSVPAGHVDPGESVLDSMIREAHEEIGIRLTGSALRFGLVLDRKSTEDGDERIDFFFIADGAGYSPRNMEPYKCDELVWAPISALPSTVIPYVRYAIAEVSMGNMYSQFGW